MRLCLLLGLLTLGCERRAPVDAGVSSLPWQPHGLRAPTVACELTVPPSLTRSASPMPDHLAEFFSKEMPPRTSVIVAERVETALPAALERVRTFHRSSLLTSPGAKVVLDEALEGAAAKAHVIDVRWGAAQVESVTLLAFEGLPLVEVVARYDEADPGAKAGVETLVRSLRCTKK